MQQTANPHALRGEIISLMSQNGLDMDCYTEMLDYAIDLFESQGLGADYYGYHNITHELEVTYVVMLSATREGKANGIGADDLRHLFVAALFHDFDPQKSVDKPHEESVIRYISTDAKLQGILKQADVDLDVVKSMIHRTTYPWAGRLREEAEGRIGECFMRSDATRNNAALQNHYMQLGWFLSIADRISGYALGDFGRAIELSKMNAHALAWHPSLMVQRAVAYFEHLIGEEADMCQRVLHSLPQHMRRNFMDTILSFMQLRQNEIRIRADYVYENLKIVPVMEKPGAQMSQKFVESLREIYDELPRPLQFMRDGFAESLADPDTILNTIRLGGPDGEVIGFAKGGPLERYELRPEIRDENYGLKNTAFLEPLALKMGYWGLRGGSEMRNLFAMQAHSKKFTYITSFSLRDVVEKRAESYEGAEFVMRFDPERWDYYRIRI